jgi:predicted protein tyrosine phosphatase
MSRAATSEEYARVLDEAMAAATFNDVIEVRRHWNAMGIEFDERQIDEIIDLARQKPDFH